MLPAFIRNAIHTARVLFNRPTFPYSVLRGWTTISVRTL
jgi:hypothetical protein